MGRSDETRLINLYVRLIKVNRTIHYGRETYLWYVNWTNPSVLKSLVVASLLCLLAFLLSWNIENYNRKYDELHQDLTDQMSLACSEYRDSVIQGIFRVIDFDPIEERVVGPSFRLEISDDSSAHWQSTQVLQFESTATMSTTGADSINISINNASHTRDTMIRVMVDNDRDRRIIVWDSDVAPARTTVEYLTDTVHGVDLIDEIALDTLIKVRRADYNSVTSSTIPLLYVKLDSIFSNRVKMADIHLDHQLQVLDRSSDSIQVADLSVPFEYGNLLDSGRPYAYFSTYKRYLLGQIAPSILMSLLLFSIVGASFLILLRSWLSQLRLTSIKNEFISNMTHELKTPISTVGVALEALESFGGLEDEKKRSEYLEISKHEVNRLKILVDKVLKMSTLDQGQEELMMSRVDIRKLTEETLKSMKLHFEKNHASLEYHIEGNHFDVNGDKVHLTNVLYNLIDNSIKYAYDKPKVAVSLMEEAEDIILSITDNGKGIPRQYQDKVFDRFFRVPTADVHDVKGHGLGLHYVQTIIEKHKGQISINSKIKEGTTINVKLPKANG